MNDISVGAVGAAIIAGLVSLLGLIIGKEQKVSEFRQAWIDDLRKCLVAYLVNVNAISDSVRSGISGKTPDKAILLSNYKLLNEASHGIVLRVNPQESVSQELLKSMERFEALAESNAGLTPENIKIAEQDYLNSSKALLKFEWKRVKRGEDIFVWTKRVVLASTVAMLVLFGWLWASRSGVAGPVAPANQPVQVVQSVSVEAACDKRSEESRSGVANRVQAPARQAGSGRQRALPADVCTPYAAEQIEPLP